MPEPSDKKHRRNKEAEDRLAKKYRDIGIKAVAAAVEPTNNATENAKSPPNPIGRATMNKHEQSARFADKSTKAAREIIECSIRSAEEATNGAKLNLRELNIKLIEMAHANMDAVFDLAHEIASAKAPSDLVPIWSAYAKQQFEMMTQQAKELTEVGQKLASPNNGGVSPVKG